MSQPQKVGENRTELIGYLNLVELLEAKGEMKKAKSVRETAESLASILGIDMNEFYDGDEDNGDDDDGDDDSDDDDIVDFNAEYEFNDKKLFRGI